MSRMSRSNRGYLFFAVFAAGMTTLAVEFTTSRLLQTVYGASNIVWANVIGLVLLFLTAGYFLGGRLADRRPEPAVFYGLIVAAGLSSIVCLLLTTVLLRAAATALSAVNAGAVAGSLVGVVLALAVPVTLLGCLSPFAVRLAVDDVGEAGRMSGAVYALSTLGSLAGTYLPVLVTIPLAGTRVTAILFGTILSLVGIVGLWRFRPKAAATALGVCIVLLPLPIWWSSGVLIARDGLLYEQESAYNTIQVVERGGCRYLLLNEGAGVHSVACDSGLPVDPTVWSLMLAAPLLTDQPAPQRVAMVGLAAGTTAALYSEVFGAVPIDGIELDPAIVTVGERYFDMQQPNLTIMTGDGRYELNQLEHRYDVITLDAYKVPYIPWHLTTREFFAEVRDKLTDDGVVAINVGRTSTDRRLVDALTSTLATVFASVYAVDVPDTFNTIVYATVRPTDGALAPWPDATGRLDPIRAAVNAYWVPVVTNATVFTDERAPVETIVDSLVIRHLLETGLGGVQWE